MKNEDGYIVAIGASAGGAEAISEFFANMPPDTGLSFIVLRHLKRDHKTEFPRLLKKYTSLEIVTPHNGEPVRRDHIYMMPETHKMIICNRKLFLIERPEQEIINFSINDFFHSLAKDVKNKAIAIVLSGFMTDGAEGAKEIGENGGMVMVQEPLSAQAGEMPMQTILNDHPDYILRPAEMPAQILEYIRRKSAAISGSYSR